MSKEMPWLGALLLALALPFLTALADRMRDRASNSEQRTSVLRDADLYEKIPNSAAKECLGSAIDKRVANYVAGLRKRELRDEVIRRRVESTKWITLRARRIYSTGGLAFLVAAWLFAQFDYWAMAALYAGNALLYFLASIWADRLRRSTLRRRIYKRDAKSQKRKRVKRLRERRGP